MRRFLTVLCVVLAGVAGASGLASADAANSGVDSPTLVDGFDAVTDDWGDHFSDLGNSLCNGCPDSFNTDTVVMWQAILVSEGFLSVSQIDGQFGPNTANATRQWQTRYQIGVDGQVGNQTWTKADNGLQVRTLGFLTYVFYKARGEGGVVFYRGNEGIGTLDGGAYQLDSVVTQAGDTFLFGGSIRINHFVKRIDTPVLLAKE